MGMEVTWFVVLLISTLLVLLVMIVAVSICICRRGWHGGRSIQQQNASYSLQQMYGSNGAMKQAMGGGIGGGGSTTTLPRATGSPTSGGGTGQLSGNWCRPAGPLGFLSTLVRARLYCSRAK
nr:unnamed protein product [Callosobruchus analis]